MIITAFLFIIIFFIIIYYINNNENIENFEPMFPDMIVKPGDEFILSIDLKDEFKRLRFILDKYDEQAIKYPGDTDLAKRRTALEHMLTKIIVYIHKQGTKISVNDAKELF